MKRWPLLLVAGAAVAAYEIWRRSGRRHPLTPVDPRLVDITSMGEDRGAGNLVGIQPYVTPEDYACEEQLTAKLDAYFRAARDAGLFAARTVVVLPEYLGNWLVVAGEKRAALRAHTIEQAMAVIIASNPAAFLRHLPAARERAPVIATILRMKAQRMADGYHRICSRLARTYGVTLVAGSLVLPDPYVEEGMLRAGYGPLYNVSPLYDPDGRARSPLARKVYPTADEQPFVTPAACADLPVFATPAGNLGILICADAWFPDCYNVLLAKGADLIAVPSYGLTGTADGSTWPGYSGHPPPIDIDPGDIGALTQHEAWLKYALAGRFPQEHAHAGITVFTQGRLWDISPSGQSLLITGDAVRVLPQFKGGSIVNLWLKG